MTNKIHIQSDQFEYFDNEYEYVQKNEYLCDYKNGFKTFSSEDKISYDVSKQIEKEFPNFNFPPHFEIPQRVQKPKTPKNSSSKDKTPQNTDSVPEIRPPKIGLPQQDKKVIVQSEVKCHEKSADFTKLPEPKKPKDTPTKRPVNPRIIDEQDNIDNLTKEQEKPVQTQTVISKPTHPTEIKQNIIDTSKINPVAIKERVASLLTKLQHKPETKIDFTDPAQIVDYLDKRVIGQERSKRAVAVSFSDYMTHGIVSPILFIGPSGSGKTYLTDLVCKAAHIPYVKISLANVTAEGYKGRNLTEGLEGLIGKERGVVFFDEFDKLPEFSLIFSHYA